jgi:chromosome segregation protein
VDRDVVATLEAEHADLNAQLEATAAEAGALAPQAEELANADRAVAAESEQLEARWRADGPTAAHPLAEARSELGALRSMMERGRAELRRLQAHAQAEGVRTSRLRAELDRLRATVAECDQTAGRLEEQVAEAESAFQSATRAEAAAADAHRHAEREVQRWTARAEALAQALDEARARAGAERLAGVAGVVGALLELVEIDGGLESAFEAAAGEALAAVVVDDGDAARRALQQLRESGAGGAVAVLAPLGRVGQATDGDPPGSNLGDIDGAEPLRPRVHSSRPGVAELLDRLLGTCVVVDGGWTAAVDLAQNRPDLTVVTRSGDRCLRGMWRVETTSGGVTKAALEEAGDRKTRAESSAAERGREHAAAASGLAAARAGREEAVRTVDGNRTTRQVARDALQRTEVQVTESQREADGGLIEERQLVERLTREERRVRELEAVIPELERRAEAEAERAASERLARSALADRVASVAELRRQFEVRAAGLEERRELLERQRADVDARLARNRAESEAAGERRAALEAQSRAVDRLVAGVTDWAARLDVATESLREARQQEAAAVRAWRERLEELRGQRAAAERQLAAARERANRAEVDQAEARVRLEALTDAVRRDLDCEPEATRDAPCPPLPPGASPPTRMHELERELRLLGPVNPLALEEYDVLQERHGFLDGQLEDVRAARRELGKVIRAIDAEITEVFGAAWQDVADHFERLFATLFPGGQGRLRLTDPLHLLETGIEVEARPSGKNVRRLSLLSGGERSLIALAFLFAVFRSRPSPFYLMDEVEAALDDVNLHRFLDLLHEFRQEAQLLVVSHQKRTMEAADCLYGVTMSPGGTSRVVSERVQPPAYSDPAPAAR